MAATTPTTIQLEYRARLQPAHQAVVKEMARERLTAASASPGTERHRCLVELILAGYAYAWGQVCYLTDAGKAYAATL